MEKMKAPSIVHKVSFCLCLCGSLSWSLLCLPKSFTFQPVQNGFDDFILNWVEVQLNNIILAAIRHVGEQLPSIVGIVHTNNFTIPPTTIADVSHRLSPEFSYEVVQDPPPENAKSRCGCC